jgi:hypothetical protein
MKKIWGFFAGMAVGLIAVLVIFNHTTPVAAESGSAVASDENSTTAATTDSSTSGAGDNIDVNGLMPDIKQIYFSALGDPYRQVENEITDPDIAAYFHKYMEDTGLDKVGLNH